MIAWMIKIENKISGTDWSDGKPIQSCFDGLSSQPVAGNNVHYNHIDRPTGNKHIKKTHN
jgi:hypothetical protein